MGMNKYGDKYYTDITNKQTQNRIMTQYVSAANRKHVQTLF